MKASEFCQNMLYNTGLESCYNILNPLPYYEACKWSYCEEHPNSEFSSEFACQAVESYVRTCRDEGAVPGNWRQKNFCCKYSSIHTLFPILDATCSN